MLIVGTILNKVEFLVGWGILFHRANIYNISSMEKRRHQNVNLYEGELSWGIVPGGDLVAPLSNS